MNDTTDITQTCDACGEERECHFARAYCYEGQAPQLLCANCDPETTDDQD